MFDRLITFQAQQAPHAVAVSMGGRDLSFAQFEAAVGRVAAALADEPRSALTAVRVADPYLHWLVVLALARLGTASASLPPGLEAALLPLLRPDRVIADIPATAEAEGTQPRWLHAAGPWVEAALARQDGVPARTHVPAPDALGRVIASSGTTGVPKTVGLTWRHIGERVLHMGFQLEGRTCRLLSMLDAASGAFVVSLAAWGRGGTVLFEAPQPVAIAQALSALKPTALLMSPVQLAAVVQALPPGFLPLPGLRVYASGSHTPMPLRRAVQTRLSPDLALAYGSTEAGLIAGAPAALLGNDVAAAGWPPAWVTVEVVDEQDRPLPPGVHGRIRIRGPEVVSGYRDDPAASAEQFRDGWFYPGDVGALAADGALRLEGRADEVMNFGGEKVLPQAMESVALDCPGVHDAAAFTMPDATGLPMPWLALVRDATLDQAQLDRALRAGLPNLPPIHIAWIDAIPRNAGGKIDRDRLRKAAATLSAA